MGGLHLRKLCVGVDRPEDLVAWQLQASAARGGRVWHVTRAWPKRAAELLDGGSLYWIMGGQIRARQRILGLEPHAPQGEPGAAARPYCRIVLDSPVIPVLPRPHHPFQGWRYLAAADAPPDLESGPGGVISPEVEAHLRALGVF